ncbi:MAG: TatD family hydrolase [Chloroflexi bacterium]|nr:TatD family hydrolase [Chloroflexota bacterium]MBV9133483.1 TatD family hydrolase [Chloroflexota bacterium]
MTTVDTTSGPLDVGALGFVLPHEHVMICSPEVRQVWPESFDRDAARTRCIARLRAARDAGVNTLVDVTTIDFGRDIHFVQDVATAAELPVVVCTGLWNVPILFQYQSLEITQRFFLKEITQGIEDTSQKAGIIKITTNATQMSPAQDKVFRAAARAHRQTGVPITTHTEAAEKCGLDQQRVLADEGVDLSRVIIGHSETEDYDYLRRLLERGSYLGVDRFGADNVSDPDAAARSGRPNRKQRVRIVAQLCRDGFAGQLLLSHDTSGISVFPVDWYDRTFPNGRFDYIPRSVIPELLEAGVSQREIDQMTRDNPRAIFANQMPY